MYYLIDLLQFGPHFDHIYEHARDDAIDFYKKPTALRAALLLHSGADCR